ncbi:myo-inositol-1-monophosphatase [Saccharata proteae CBS 121410]|uniref:Inositol-1-monophosphatase n=1 Tax=Saccharata proteae CBS 121410 TaxID=1314787 RepID=A0A9P4HZ25_9PEZI|nr:myo-inositol-1-monophosphatase [Saccharata proteae CBS 121410]
MTNTSSSVSSAIPSSFGSSIHTPAHLEKRNSIASSVSSLDFKDVDDALNKCLISDLDLEGILDLLVSVARTAGDMIINADPSTHASETKNNTSDRVTATDKAVEAMVHTTLTAAYPAFDFLGEETLRDGQVLSPAPTFVCDPIDGTLNFIHGFPNTAVSLALTVAKKPVVAVVLNPFRADLFTAIKGRGAHLTRASGLRTPLPTKPGPPAPLDSLNDALVAIEWGNQRSGPNWSLRTSVHQKLLSAHSDGGAMCHSVRSNGSAALDFCYVAAGWLDVFWEAGVWIWDVCAGWLILEEAGGLVASANPGDWEPEIEGRCYLAVRAATEKEGQRKVVRELWALMDGKSFVYPAPGSK